MMKAAVFFITLLFVALAACDREGPAERAGESVDRAGEKASRAIENAADNVRDAAKGK
jgi:hypothetical protein